MRWIGALVLVACSSSTSAPATPPVVPTPPPPHVDAAVPADAAIALAAPDAAPPASTAADSIQLTFMGDIMFGGTFSGRFVPQDAVANDPLVDVQPLYTSDLALANLETTVMSKIPPLEGDLRFVATPDQVALLPKDGIAAVTVANNHANDVGVDGVTETAQHLAELGLQAIGEARKEPPVFRFEQITVRGWKIGFVAATAKLNRSQHDKKVAQIPFADPDDLADTLVPVIKDAVTQNDLVIVVLHWGTQYDDDPGGWQVKAAHAFIDAGAAAVIGHHPHVLQGIERYKNGVIAYSLGNFVFQNGDPRVRDTGVLRLGFRRDGLCLDTVAFHPAIELREPIHHPEPATGDHFNEVADRLEKLSAKKPLATTWAADGDRVTTAGACGN